MIYEQQDADRALCAVLLTVIWSLLAWAALVLWVDCGKACGAQAKPTAIDRNTKEARK